jgi:serine/threonine protein kinase
MHTGPLRSCRCSPAGGCPGPLQPAAFLGTATPRRLGRTGSHRCITPHICALYDVGDHDRLPYLVMEHLEGETLEARLRKGFWSTPCARPGLGLAG